MRLLRLESGHGEVVLAEGDPTVAGEREVLRREFSHQLSQGMAALVPIAAPAGSRRAALVRSFEEVPSGAEQVIFVPPAAGGA